MGDSSHLYWMGDHNPWRHSCRIPIVELDDTELADAIQVFRRLVETAIQDSKRQTNPQIKLVFRGIAHRHQDTVEKLERAHSHRDGCERSEDASPASE
jgi:hypothetical protein